MVKVFVGGTVDTLEAQQFREYSRKYYGDNQSLALEMAIRCFNDYIKKGMVPKMKIDVTEAMVFEG